MRRFRGTSRFPVASRVSRVRRVCRQGRGAGDGAAGAAGWPWASWWWRPSGVGVAGRGVFPGRRAGGRAAGCGRAGDGGGDPAGSVGNHAGDRDAGVRRVLHGDRAGRRDADLAAAARAGDPVRGKCCTRPVTAPRWCCCTAAVPDWRALDEGITGQDVSQLNHDLVASGTPTAPEIAALGWDYYSWETAYGVQLIGRAPGGVVPAGGAAAGAGGVRAAGAAGQPGDREPGRPGVRAGADRDLGPARGDDPAGCLRTSRRLRRATR